MAKRWVVTGKRFVNPYAFISIDDECKKQEYKKYVKDEGSKKVVTGFIECELIPKTSVLIPNTSNENAFEKKLNYYEYKDANDKKEIKSYDFFSYDDLSGQDRENRYSKPVIPGSEIRGMIRSAYEAVFNCCLSSVDLDNILYKRSSKPKKPGILIKEKGKWHIEPAERIMLKCRECYKDKADVVDMRNFNEGEKVYIEVDKKGYEKKIGNRFFYLPTVKRIKKNSFNTADGKSKEGYIHIGGDFPRKHHESVFIKKDERRIEVESDAIERLKKVLELYNDDSINKKKSKKDKKWLPGFVVNEKEGGMTLIYYSDDMRYLSPSCITKEVFKNTLRDILEKYQGNHQPCSSIKSICEGCFLFGMVGDSIEDSLGTKVRFSDALPANNKDNKEYYGDIVALEELSSPKISSTEFYMKNPAGKNELGILWNYDYYIDRKSKESGKSMFDKLPKISGRKFYWHSDKEGKVISGNLSKLNTLMRPLKGGEENTFTFKVYFDEISKEMLTKLAWVISIGNNRNNCHKIGRGKPIGYGSVRINIRQIKTRNIKIDGDTIKYKTEPLGLNNFDYSIVNVGNERIKEFLKITDFENKPKNVSYPKVEGSSNIYEWFGANREIRPREAPDLKITSTRQAIHKALPDILDKDIELSVYKMEEK